MDINFENAQFVTNVHDTVFFDDGLNPVTPVIGQWFCEFEAYYPLEGIPYLRDEALVEYVGGSVEHVFENGALIERPGHRVAAELCDSDRTPRGIVLILQSSQSRGAA